MSIFYLFVYYIVLKDHPPLLVPPFLLYNDDDADRLLLALYHTYYIQIHVKCIYKVHPPYIL